MSKIEQIIDDLQTYIGECKSPAFSGGSKIVCEKNAIEEFLEDLKLSTPEEIKKYQQIIERKDMIIAEAKHKSETLISEAQKKQQKMIDSHEIMQRAYEEANKLVETAQQDAQSIINSASQEAKEIREGAMEYADNILGDLEGLLNQAVSDQEERSRSLIENLKEVEDTVRGNREELAGSKQQVSEKKNSDEAFDNVDFDDVPASDDEDFYDSYNTEE